MLHTETFEIVKADETFLDLPIENWEVILPLGSPSSDTKSPLRVDRDAFDREGVGRSVCCALDKSAVFAVSHEIADVYDQVHRLAFLD